MGYSEKDIVLKENDGTIKIGVIGITPEEFDLAVSYVEEEPFKETPTDGGLSLAHNGKFAIAAHPKETRILLVDSVLFAPEKQHIIVQTTIDKLRDVKQKNQSEQLLVECAEEYVSFMGRKHPKTLVLPITNPYEKLVVPADSFLGFADNLPSVSKHRNSSYYNPAKKKRRNKDKKKSRRANRR